MPDSQVTHPAAARILLWLLGGWLFLAGATGFMAGSNFAILKPDRLERAAHFYGDIPQEKREMALRYAASELNRVYFAQSYTLQMVIAVAAVALCLLSGSRGRKLLATFGVLVLISAILSFYVTPEIIHMGKEIDDVPREPITPDREAFNHLHHFAVIIDVVKMALIAGAAAATMRILRRAAS